MLSAVFGIAIVALPAGIVTAGYMDEIHKNERESWIKDHLEERGRIIMSTITIRDAKLEDAKRLVEIYGYYVEHTVITFEYETPSVEEFQERMRHIMERYPYLVIKVDGKVEGYAYAGAFVGRAAYDWSCELTIYLDHNREKCGLGRKLYEALEASLKKMGILNLYACIGYPQVKDEYLTKNSAQFHAHLGFETVGTFQKCGYKFERWYDMIWMEKIIGAHQIPQVNIIPYKDLGR